MINNFPEINTVINKSFDVAAAAIDYNAKVFTDTIDFVNQITDKMFYTYTVKAQETVKAATEYAKENIATGKTKVKGVFAGA